MRSPDFPSVQTAEEPLAGSQLAEVLLDVRPCPVGDTNDAIAGVRFCAACTHLPASDIYVRLDACERGRYFDARAVQKRVERTIRRQRPMDDPLDVTKFKLHDPTVTAGTTSKGYIISRWRSR